MSLQDVGKQKTELEKQLTKFSELMPSVRPIPLPIKRALVLIDGTPKSRTSVLLAQQLNQTFGTKIDVVCFYTETSSEQDIPTRESYEASLTYAYEHLQSEDFTIKGQVVENVEILQEVLEVIIRGTKYDVIVIPTSFIGIHQVVRGVEESDAKITVMGDIFNFLLEKNKIPVFLIQSEALNVEMLWLHAALIIGSTFFLKHSIEKVMQFTVEKATVHTILNINPQLHAGETEEEFSAFIERNKIEMETFEKANSEVFKEARRFFDFRLLTSDDIEEFKRVFISFGKPLGMLVVYMPSKHASVYGVFVDILSDPEITVPILILKDEEKKEKEEKEELKKPEETKEEKKEEETIEEIVEAKKEEIIEEVEEVKESLIEEIKEEVKKELLGEEKEKKEESKKPKVEEEVIKDVEKEKEKTEPVAKEPEEKKVRKMSEIEEIKEEAKEKVIEEIKKEVKKEVKEEPKKELKKAVEKELKKMGVEGLKEEIIDKIIEEIKEEIVYELKKDLEVSKEEIKEQVIDELQETIRKEEEKEEEKVEKEEKEEKEEEEDEIKLDFE